MFFRTSARKRGVHPFDFCSRLWRRPWQTHTTPGAWEYTDLTVCRSVPLCWSSSSADLTCAIDIDSVTETHMLDDGMNLPHVVLESLPSTVAGCGCIPSASIPCSVDLSASSEDKEEYRSIDIDTHLEPESELELCAVCLEAPCDVVLQPCGHTQLCETCACKLLRCPLCRASILSHEGSRFTYIVCTGEWV
uniref:RING-type domain-containing protein n=1 Tax=Noctiluca scintillans TaxID=2966 RepID=A0A7S1A7G2_NOCSC|mmetsp:Transcript_34803/g.92940  ORF Transcript_34803/g.92940 Transcript_34803/m.92940 type:complete len:192 (+) Transcript_34803:55-630(+)